MDSKVPEKGAYNKTHNNNSKPIECYYCKQKGHTSPNCPKKNSRHKKSANTEALKENDELDDDTANAADIEENSDTEEIYTSAEEAYEALYEDALGDVLSLEDWCACIRTGELTDSDEELVTSRNEPDGLVTSERLPSKQNGQL
ncbi:hypothetical protein APHAL10511_008642 [Amanita phalloides]|nr:hypothetical protein APHAL10511_008642 [Amanita phalloides]